MELTALDLEILADRVASKLEERLERRHDEMVEAAFDGGRDGAEHYIEHLSPHHDIEAQADSLERIIRRMLGEDGRSPCAQLKSLHAALRRI